MASNSILHKISLARFFLKTIILLIVLGICWYFIAPVYDRVLTAVSGLLINGQAVLKANDSIYFYKPNGLLAGGVYALSLHYGLVLVIVLIAATPGMKLVRRLQATGIAVAGIFLLNVISIVLFAQRALSGAADAGTGSPVIVLFAVLGSDLFPVVIWAGLSYRYFLVPKAPATGLKTSAARV